MSRKEIATKLVNAGFRSMSKEHHPDRAGGDLETQKVLADVRDFLVGACKKMPPQQPLWHDDADSRDRN
jgi:hypothetical protein